MASALEAKPNNVRASQLLAQVYRRTDRLPKAIALLEPISSHGPAIRLQLAAISLESELGEDAPSRAKELVASYNRRQQDGQEIGLREYRRSMRAHLILGNSNDAISVLERGFSVHPDDFVLRQSLADLCQVQFDQLARRGRATVEDRLEMIQKAMGVAPEDPDVLRRVAQLSAVGERVGQQCQKLLEPFVGSDDIPAVVRLAFARAALRKKDYTAARHLYQQLHESDPTSGGVMITLAQLLAMTEPIDLPAALSMADKAVERAPENVRFRQNRGQVLLRLERWPEAIDDLEMAVNGMPRRPDVHESLALAYEKTGNSELASVHRQQAEQLKKAGETR